MGETTATLDYVRAISSCINDITLPYAYWDNKLVIAHYNYICVAVTTMCQLLVVSIAAHSVHVCSCVPHQSL